MKSAFIFQKFIFPHHQLPQKDIAHSLKRIEEYFRFESLSGNDKRYTASLKQSSPNVKKLTEQLDLQAKNVASPDKILQVQKYFFF